MPHEFRKVAFRRANRKVKVIGHQGISEKTDLKNINKAGQQAKKVPSVLRTAKDCPLLISTAGQMIIRIRILDSQRSAHDAHHASEIPKC